jgi:hypothetical protein
VFCSSITIIANLAAKMPPLKRGWHFWNATRKRSFQIRKIIRRLLLIGKLEKMFLFIQIAFCHLFEFFDHLEVIVTLSYEKWFGK